MTRKLLTVAAAVGLAVSIPASAETLPHCAVEDASYGPLPCWWSDPDDPADTLLWRAYRASLDKCPSGDGIVFVYPRKPGQTESYKRYDC